jgi:rare lipoprotein A
MGAAALASCLALAACANAEAPLAAPSAASPRSAGVAFENPGRAPTDDGRSEVQRGYASWYGASLAGHRMSNGDRFDPSKMTAAHRTLPFGTWVEVRRADGMVLPPVRVQITDRGPFGHAGRIIDLARAAADRLGIVKSGVALVEVRVVGGP